MAACSPERVIYPVKGTVEWMIFRDYGKIDGFAEFTKMFKNICIIFNYLTCKKLYFRLRHGFKYLW